MSSLLLLYKHMYVLFIVLQEDAVIVQFVEM